LVKVMAPIVNASIKRSVGKGLVGRGNMGTNGI
jgi:hypothetical protein